MITSEAALAQIREQLGAFWSDSVETVIRDRYVSSGDTFEPEDLADIVEIAMAWLSVPPIDTVARQRESSDVARRRAAPPEGLLAVSDHFQAVGFLRALEASRKAEVVAVREAVGGLIPWRDLADWVNAQAREEGHPTLWLEIPVADPSVLEQTRQGLRLNRSLGLARVEGFHRRYLHFSVPGDLVARVRPVRAGGLLDRVALLAERLHGEYNWELQQAGVFILSGPTPVIEPVRSSASEPAESVTLAVEPEVGASHLVRVYRAVRQRSGRRFVPIGRKNATAATFAASLPSRSWPERMGLWNDAYPEWRYTSPRQFGRDARETQRRLMRR